MEKTTQKSCTEINLPPGSVIVSGQSTPQLGSVTFPQTKSVDILSPYVEAYYNAKDNSLTATAVVYVDETTIQNGVFYYSVFQNSYIDIAGAPQLQFFIVYDMPEELSVNFGIYEITFQADPTIFSGGLSNVESIQTFLWDADPITSRGTETTVQHG
ncbi:hypothetical protein SGQ44_08475 [Flavobacterium sp. Fl-77]|uniref:Uncharacterized protein n=1 Tax=Flavobacterium flavipigmentatum TaxID=2893884 RepID=A0AAJ2VX33_9FLAO|nr:MULTISPECIES: hypothetical protein [unclassified Flavobacterium]MDX6182299.1 hypothetical protein [Flavobacterium sp. Fl-33]MDX6185788.1 hypothetical protein [Flavobacterium sp. Fl-77]UFH38968.1 hypothetical protein LNP22_01525 [Flavobacterium sp. F-70]